MKKKSSFNISAWLPIFMFLFFLIVLGGATVVKNGFSGSIFSAANLQNLFNQTVATIIAGLGMMWVAAMGSTDITAGVVVALVGTFGLLATAGGAPSIVFILIALAIGFASGLLLGFVNAKLHVNSFMGSLALMMAYRAVVQWVMSDKSLYLPEDLEFLDNFWFKVVVLIALVLMIQYSFKFTRFGNYARGIGENELAVRFTGVNVDMVKIAVFIVSGVMFAIAGIFTIARQGGTSSTIGTGFEMKVMMALYIGGVPVRGGEGTKVYKLLFGSLTITLLEIALVLLNAQSAVVQLIKGIILLGAVYLTNLLAKRLAYVGASGAENQKLVESGEK